MQKRERQNREKRRKRKWLIRTKSELEILLRKRRITWELSIKSNLLKCGSYEITLKVETYLRLLDLCCFTHDKMFQMSSQQWLKPCQDMSAMRNQSEISIWNISCDVPSRRSEWCTFSLSLATVKVMWPWTTKPVIRVHLFTFMHLADTFIQSDLQCIRAIHLFIFYQYVCSLGIKPTTFCAANAMLYHWATGTHF